MTNHEKFDLTDLARDLAEIASKTTDPETGRLLMEVVKRLLETAGLPPEGGGSKPPSHWISGPTCLPALA